MNQKTAILLINIGTPENPTTGKVRKFLRSFLNDKRVMDIPFLLRKILVNLIIVPFRAPKSAKLYQKMWTPDGSPILVYGNSLKEKIQHKLGANYTVELGMRYSKPSIEDGLQKIFRLSPSTIIIVPLFPQYASSTTGSAVEKALSVISKWEVIPELKIINNFYSNTGFIDAFTNRIKHYNLRTYDHILFSYHGLPLRQVYKAHEMRSCEDLKCIDEITDSNATCYQAQCYETSRLIAKQLNLPTTDYTICFQSRFAKKWLSPFTDDVIKNLAKKGFKKLLVVSPSFVADCLETIVEIGIDYNELFRSVGGESLTLVKSLNDQDDWVETLSAIIE